MNATLRNDLLPVRHTGRNLELDVPNGWDDVQKLVGKVLEFEDRTYVFTGWNSDRNVCYFRPGNAAKIL